MDKREKNKVKLYIVYTNACTKLRLRYGHIYRIGLKKKCIVNSQARQFFVDMLQVVKNQQVIVVKLQIKEHIFTNNINYVITFQKFFACNLSTQMTVKYSQLNNSP